MQDRSVTICEDVIIVDEASMCDIFILADLFFSIDNDNARILFIGDDFQLPSVGVGNFLYDSINSGLIKVSQLKKVFRQKNGGILDVATKMRNGQAFLESDQQGRVQFGSDCVFWLADQEFLLNGILSKYMDILKKYDISDVTVLSPTNKGKLGTVAINKEIQKLVNPKSPLKFEKTFGKDPATQVTFREGDLVMNTVNTYDIETVDPNLKADVFNGDTGKIVGSEDGKVMLIEFDGIVVKMKMADVAMNLIHGWSTSIHKAQGSQYKVVLIVLDGSMKFQLNANLMYTAVSRASEILLILGQANVINFAIKKFANMERRSLLQEYIHELSDNTEVGKEQFEENEKKLPVIEENPFGEFDFVKDERMIEEYDVGNPVSEHYLEGYM